DGEGERQLNARRLRIGIEEVENPFDGLGGRRVRVGEVGEDLILDVLEIEELADAGGDHGRQVGAGVGVIDGRQAAQVAVAGQVEVVEVHLDAAQGVDDAGGEVVEGVGEGDEGAERRVDAVQQVVGRAAVADHRQGRVQRVEDRLQRFEEVVQHAQLGGGEVAQERAHVELDGAERRGRG